VRGKKGGKKRKKLANLCLPMCLIEGGKRGEKGRGVDIPCEPRKGEREEGKEEPTGSPPDTDSVDVKKKRRKGKEKMQLKPFLRQDGKSVLTVGEKGEGGGNGPRGNEFSGRFSLLTKKRKKKGKKKKRGRRMEKSIINRISGRG